MALQEKDKKLLTVLGIAILGYGIYMGFISDTGLLKSYEKLENKVAEKKKKIEDTRKKAKQLQTIRKELKQLQEEVKVLSRELPEQKTYLQLIPAMDDLAKDLGLRFKYQGKALQPQIEHEGGLYIELPTTIKPTMRKYDEEKNPSGALSYKSMVRMLYAFNEYEKLTDIKKFTFKPVSSNKDRFDVTFIVSFYMFNEEAFK